MDCSYCNGEIGRGSRYKTPYVVGILSELRQIAHAMQQPPGIRVMRRRRRGESRERKKLSAAGGGNQLRSWTLPGSPRGLQLAAEVPDGSGEKLLTAKGAKKGREDRKKELFTPRAGSISQVSVQSAGANPGIKIPTE